MSCKSTPRVREPGSGSFFNSRIVSGSLTSKHTCSVVRYILYIISYNTRNRCLFWVQRSKWHLLGLQQCLKFYLVLMPFLSSLSHTHSILTIFISHTLNFLWCEYYTLATNMTLLHVKLARHTVAPHSWIVPPKDGKGMWGTPKKTGTVMEMLASTACWLKLEQSVWTPGRMTCRLIQHSVGFDIYSNKCIKNYNQR